LRWQGPAQAGLTIDVSNEGEIDSPDKVLQTEYDRRLKMKDASEEIRWAEVDGVKGILTRSVDNERGRVNWLSYRPYQGKYLFVSIGIGVPAKNFKQREPELYGILYSIKFTKVRVTRPNP